MGGPPNYNIVGPSINSSPINLWQPNTVYSVLGAQVSYNGQIYEVTTVHTSGSSFDSSKFTLLGSGDSAGAIAIETARALAAESTLGTEISGITPQNASTSIKGISTLSVAPISSTSPIALGANDPSVTNARIPTPHASTHAPAGADPLITTDLPTAVDVGAFTYGTAVTGTRTTLKLRDFISVKDFGAKGDGVTDDTVAIQNAITSLPQPGGGVIYFPAGAYIISSTLTWSDRCVILRGAGTSSQPNAGGTRLNFSSGVTGINIQNGSLGYGARSRIESMRILGSDTIPGTNDGILLQANETTISDVDIEGFAGSGINIDSSAGTAATNGNIFRIDHVRCAFNLTSGFRTFGSNSNAGTITSLDCTNNGPITSLNGSITLPQSSIVVTNAAILTNSYTTTTAGVTLPIASISVASTAGYQKRGIISVGGQIVTYADTDGTHFLQCQGGSGTISSGSSINPVVNIYGQLVSYTGISSNTLTGCVGGSGTFTTGIAVGGSGYNLVENASLGNRYLGIHISTCATGGILIGGSSENSRMYGVYFESQNCPALTFAPSGGGRNVIEFDNCSRIDGLSPIIGDLVAVNFISLNQGSGLHWKKLVVGSDLANQPNLVIDGTAGAADFNAGMQAIFQNAAATTNWSQYCYTDGRLLLGSASAKSFLLQNQIQLQGGLSFQRKAIADANYTVSSGPNGSGTPADTYIAFSSISAPRTVTIPSIASVTSGTVLIIADESGSCNGTNTITLSGANINGAGSYILNSAHSYVSLLAGASSWQIVGSVGSSGGSGIANYQKFTNSGTFTVPAGVTNIKARGIAAGAGGGGGGSTSGATLQSGGGGGAGGSIIDIEISVTPADTLTITIGAGGTAGSGGASGGAAGTGGGTGGTTSIVDGATTLLAALGGVPGVGSAANSVTVVGGGIWAGVTTNITAAGITAGTGGGSAQVSGYPMLAVVGGSGGGAANATPLGGGGGNAQLSSSYLKQNNGGTSGGSATTSGVSGTTATQPGCGGAGGGGGANGGSGGSGGVGGSGQVELWW